MTERDPHDTMTEDTRRTTNRPTTERTDYRPELGDVSHTNPYTGQVFGDTQTYGRGRTVAADGGEANAAEADDGEREVNEETMEDVAHEPPGDADSAQAAYDRGAADE